MTTFLPKEVQAGLDAARKKAMRRGSRLRVEADGESYRVLKLRENGFTMSLDTAPHLRGLVDIFDGGKQISNCLIIASDAEGDLMHYEFKRSTPASDSAPLDFDRGANAPVALIGKD